MLIRNPHFLFHLFMFVTDKAVKQSNVFSFTQSSPRS